MAVVFLTVFLFIFNVIQVLLATVLGGASIWFFTEVLHLMSMRNPDDYRLKGVVTWPEVLPWIFVVAAVSTILTNLTSFCCLTKRNKSLTMLYVLFQTISVVFLIAAPIVAVTATDNVENDKLISTTLWDAFHNNKHVVDSPYNSMESKLRCCGVNGPSDYYNKFPKSCCRNGETCALSDSYANKLSGCENVVKHYSKFLTKGLCIGSSIIAIIGFLCVIIAVILFINLKTKSQKYENREEKKLNQNAEKVDCQTVLL